MAGRYHTAERLVVKVGTGTLFEADGDGYRFLADQMNALVEEVAELSKGRQVALVSSGAIASAACEYGLEIPDDRYGKARLAGMGQPILMHRYLESFSKRGTRCAQCLITHDDMFSERRRKLRKVLDGYLSEGVVPIVNENDTIATDDITFGDNDIMAAILTRCIRADLLAMLSNAVEGLGTGGGLSKEEARKILDKHGIPLEIINGRYEQESGVWKPKIRLLF